MRKTFLILLALCLVLAIAPCVSAQGLPSICVPGLVIAHMTDAHITTLGNVSAQRAKAVFLSAQGDVLVDTGDCTEHGTALEWGRYQRLAVLRGTRPFHVTAGNHDSGLVPYPQGWVVDVKGVRLVGVDSRRPSLPALELALGGTSLPAVVFGHFDFGFYDPGKQAALRAMFRAHGVLAYVAGHSHLETDVLDASGTRFITAGPASRGYWQRIAVTGRDVAVMNIHLY